MVGVLILTHGRMAAELLAAAQKITGDLAGFEALTLDWNDGLDEARVKVSQAIERLDTGDGVLVMTDIFGGTPSNVAMHFATPGQVEVVSGVNLPMVVKLGCVRSQEMPLVEMPSWIQKKGRASICTSQSIPRPGRASAPPCEPCDESES